MRGICIQIAVFALGFALLFVGFPQSVSATHGFDSGPVVITVHGEAFTVYGYAGDILIGSSFRLMDIAYILSGTRAQFDFCERSLRRGVPYVADGTEFLPITERRFALYGSYGLVDSHGLVVTNHDVFTIAEFGTHWGFGRGVVHEFAAVHDVDYLYFSLAQLGRVLGFTYERDWHNNRYVIHTYEPKISVYGLAAARDFLRNYPRYEHFSYFFQDFTENGIPVVFVHNEEIAGDNRWHYMYVYAEGNFDRQGQVGSHEFFRCRDGNVYLFRLVPGDDDRPVMVIQPLIFTETGVAWGDAVVIEDSDNFDVWNAKDLTSVRPFYNLETALCVRQFRFIRAVPLVTICVLLRAVRISGFWPS